MKLLLIAPMASNRLDRVQSSSSQPPAKTTSCLPIWICSAPAPMQWAQVAQAELIEKLIPRILNQVDSTADGPELMALGTANGPIRLGPFSRVVAAASTITRVDGPPEPTIRPVRSLETSVSSRPASAIACSMAMWA